jgi:hypothetical protein
LFGGIVGRNFRGKYCSGADGNAKVKLFCIPAVKKIEK